MAHNFIYGPVSKSVRDRWNKRLISRQTDGRRNISHQACTKTLPSSENPSCKRKTRRSSESEKFVW